MSCFVVSSSQVIDTLERLRYCLELIIAWREARDSEEIGKQALSPLLKRKIMRSFRKSRREWQAVDIGG